MSCITKQRIGKYIYLYESVSFRDGNKRPRNKKMPIGKIDPETKTVNGVNFVRPLTKMQKYILDIFDIKIPPVG